MPSLSELISRVDFFGVPYLYTHSKNKRYY